jgi:hypothetical protein
MRKFIVERQLPAIGSAEGEELKAIARSFNKTLAGIGNEIQWVESYVTEDITYCVFFAPDEEILRRYIDKTGFPADEITEIATVIDPSTRMTG